MYMKMYWECLTQSMEYGSFEGKKKLYQWTNICEGRISNTHSLIKIWRFNQKIIEYYSLIHSLKPLKQEGLWNNINGSQQKEQQNNDFPKGEICREEIKVIKERLEKPQFEKAKVD